MLSVFEIWKQVIQVIIWKNTHTWLKPIGDVYRILTSNILPISSMVKIVNKQMACIYCERFIFCIHKAWSLFNTYLFFFIKSLSGLAIIVSKKIKHIKLLYFAYFFLGRKTCFFLWTGLFFFFYQDNLLTWFYYSVEQHTHSYAKGWYNTKVSLDRDRLEGLRLPLRQNKRIENNTKITIS